LNEREIKRSEYVKYLGVCRVAVGGRLR